jgi:hypothetical protein
LQAVLLIAKIIALSVAGLVALVLLFFACVLVRKSMPYVFAGDIERLAATGPYNSEGMATEMCGYAVDYVGSAETESPAQGLPKARVLSWPPLYPIEGTASVRISGIGFNRTTDRPTGPCEATMTFRYRFAWADNGRAVVLESSFVERPVIDRQ